MGPKFEQLPQVCHPIFHICALSVGQWKGGGGGAQEDPQGRAGGQAGRACGYSHRLKVPTVGSTEARTHSMQGAIHMGPGPWTTERAPGDRVRSQLAGILGPWLPTACCRAGVGLGPRQHQSRMRIMGRARQNPWRRISSP